MFSQTLGTALGDWMADDTGLGYGSGAVVFGVALAVVAELYFYTTVSRVVLFWAAFRRGSNRAVYGLHRKWPEPRQPRVSTFRV